MIRPNNSGVRKRLVAGAKYLAPKPQKGLLVEDTEVAWAIRPPTRVGLIDFINKVGETLQ